MLIVSPKICALAIANRVFETLNPRIRPSDDMIFDPTWAPQLWDIEGAASR